MIDSDKEEEDACSARIEAIVVCGSSNVTVLFLVKGLVKRS